MIQFDQNDTDQQLIIGAMANLIDRGYSPQEVFKLLDDIKENTWSALSQIASENKK